MLELIKLQVDDYASEVGDYLRICQSSLANMLHIITHYLDSQKLDEGLITPITQRFDLMSVVKEAA